MPPTQLTTINKSLRYPVPGQGVMVDQYNQMAYDLDNAYTNEDVTRSAAMRRFRSRMDMNHNQSVPKATPTAISFDSVVYDNSGLSQAGVGVNPWSARSAAGTYLFTAGAGVQPTGDVGFPGCWQLAFALNGTVPGVGKKYATDAGFGSFNRVSCWGIYRLAVNDFINLTFFWTGTPTTAWTVTFATLNTFYLGA